MFAVREARRHLETKERYGRFVLQSEDARTSAGSFFRAVQLGTSGYERHVQLFRSELLAPEVAQALADGLKNGLAVQHAQVVRGFEAGRLDKTAFSAYELFEGRSVGALMERSQAEGHPFAADHALLIASKAAAALEAAQGKKQTHGFLVPEFIHVSHDGEVSVRGFGLPPRVLRNANCVGVREARFLAPELEGTVPLDIRADVFSLGAQLFEMLTGVALPRTESTLKSIEAARIQSPGTDGAPIPKALAALLGQALAEDLGRRFKDATAFKKAVDTLLFSGDYSPTTFNLAFFMHTLFRDEGDDDAARIKAEKNADYRPYLAEMSAPPAAAAPTVVSASGLVHGGPASTPAAPPRAALDSTLRMDAIRPEAFKAEAAKFEPVKHDSGRISRVPAPAASPAPPSPAEDQLFQSILAEKKGFPVAPVVIGVVVVAAVAGYFLTRSAAPTPGPATAPTMNAAETAALARVRELESRLAALEAEKVAAEQKAADEAKKTIEAQAKAKGRAVDPAELQKAQDEARKKAQADQEARLQAERLKIEEERKKAEETRAAEAARAAEVAKAFEAAAASPSIAPASTPAPVAASPASPPPTAAVPPPAGAAAAPAPAGGPALLDLSDPVVVAPILVSQFRIEYPPIARAQRITGSVVVSALVDEQGNVAEVRLIRGVAGTSGLNQAALDNVKRRKYKPATLNGKPGRAWVAIQIDFKL